MAQVVLDVEVRVVHPHRPPELEGDEPHLLAVPRHEVELGVHHVDDVGERRRRALEDGDGGDVHVRHVVLDVEERGVQGAQAVRTHAALPSEVSRLDERYYRLSGPPRPGLSRRRRQVPGSPSVARNGRGEDALARVSS